MRIAARPQPHQDEDSRLDLAAARCHHEREYAKWHERARRCREAKDYHELLSARARARRTMQ